MYIKFKNLEEKLESIKSISNNIVKIITIEQPNLTGFQVFTDNGDLLGDYSDFTTLYKQESDGYMLSNDGSVYTEPEEIPTYAPTLEEVKEQKKAELSINCKETIYKGTDVAFSEKTEHFSLTIEDQLNLMRKKDQLEKGETKIEYHADGKPFRYYTKEDMKKIIDTTDEFINYQTSYCNSLFQWVNALNSIEEINKIKYGDLVPLKFQSKPLKEMMI